MTRDVIIANLYESKNFNDAVNKVCDQPHWRDDLKAEVALIICQWENEKVIRLHADGVLEFYVVRVLMNQIQSNTSPFYRKYRQTHHAVFNEEGKSPDDQYQPKTARINKELCEEDVDTADRQTKEGLEDVAMAIVEAWSNSVDNSLHYRGNLIKLYMKLGNYRAIQKETGIPFISCFKNIKQSIEMLREMVLNKPVFTKDELRQIQNNTPKLNIKL
jgi:hypothetical protein